MSHAAPALLRIVTYNVHRSIGMDRRTRPERIAAVLRDIGADIVALQEVVGAGPRGGSHIEEIGAALAMGWVMAPARQWRSHQFGNAILSRFPIVHHAEHDLSWKTCEERCLQRADVDVEGHTLHLQRHWHRNPRAPYRQCIAEIVSTSTSAAQDRAGER